MHGEERGDRFQLDHDFGLDDEVQSAFADHVAFVVDANDWLTFVVNPSKRELDAQGAFVDRFRVAGTNQAVHFYRRADDAMRTLIECTGRLRPPTPFGVSAFWR